MKSIIQEECQQAQRLIRNIKRLGKQTSLELIALDPFNSELSPTKK